MDACQAFWVMSLFFHTGLWGIVRKEMAWNRQRGLTALKGAVSGILALYVADLFNMPHPYWILISIVMVNQGSVGGSLDKVAGRVFGTISGMTGALIPVFFFPQERLVYAVFFAVFIFVTALGYAGKAAPQGFMRASVYGAVIGFIGIQTPELVPAYYGWRILDVFLAAGIVLLVQALLIPVYAVNDFRHLLTKNCGEMALALRGLSEPMQREKARETLRQMGHRAGAVGEKLQALAKQSRIEGWDADVAANWQRGPLGLFENLMVLGSGLGAAGEMMGSQSAVQAIAEKIDAVHGRCAELLDSDFVQDDSGSPGSLHESVAALEHGYEGYRESGALHVLPDETIWALHGNMQATTRFAAILQAIPPALASPPSEANSSPGAWWRSVFNTAPDGLAFATRLLVAAFATFWFVLAFNWESGVAAVISVFIITQSTLGRSYRKMIQRLIGCVLGGVFATLAMVMLVPNFDAFWQMASLLGVLMFGACYVASGGPRFSYVGIQAALIIVILLVPDASQPLDLVGFWQRLTGILLACTVTVLVSILVFPVTSSGKLRGLIQERILLLGELFASRLLVESETRHDSKQEMLRLTHAMNELDTLLWEAGAEGDRELSAGNVARLTAALDAATCAVLAIPSVDIRDFPEELAAALRPPLLRLGQALREIGHGNGEAIRACVSEFEGALKQLRVDQAFQGLPAFKVRQVIGWASLVLEAGTRGAELADVGMGRKKSVTA